MASIDLNFSFWNYVLGPLLHGKHRFELSAWEYVFGPLLDCKRRLELLSGSRLKTPVFHETTSRLRKARPRLVWGAGVSPVGV